MSDIYYTCEACGKYVKVGDSNRLIKFPGCYQYTCPECGRVGLIPSADIDNQIQKQDSPVDDNTNNMCKTDEEFLNKLKDKLSAYQSTLDQFAEPIYEIRVCDYVNNPNIWESMGYYRNLDDAINCVLENRLDFHEDCYDDCFILCRFEGVYNDCDYRGRLYFSWDDNEHKYRPKYEPKCYRRTSFI